MRGGYLLASYGMNGVVIRATCYAGHPCDVAEASDDGIGYIGF